MFEYQPVEGLDSGAVASQVSDVYRLMVVAETRLLRLAAHWADLQSSDVLNGSEQPLRGVERSRLVGGDGTPQVTEFAAAELGPLMETTTQGAWNMIADALDLRHRLPCLWDRVLAGQVRVWKARKVAQATRHLPPEAAGYVDQAVAGFISSLSWARFENLLIAKIIETDPANAEARARLYQAERFVRVGASNQNGLKTVIARSTAGDAILFMAMVNRIAEILQAEGDTDTVEVRRSKAIRILAQPATALDLLYRHQHDVNSRDIDEPQDLDQPEEPDQPEEADVEAEDAQGDVESDPASANRSGAVQVQPLKASQSARTRASQSARTRASQQQVATVWPLRLMPGTGRSSSRHRQWIRQAASEGDPLHSHRPALLPRPPHRCRQDGRGGSDHDRPGPPLPARPRHPDPDPARHRPDRQPPRRRLRNTTPAPRGTPTADTRRRLPVQHQHQPTDGPRPLNSLPGPRQRRPTRPDQPEQPRSDDPTPPPHQNPRPMATTTTRPR